MKKTTKIVIAILFVLLTIVFVITANIINKKRAIAAELRAKEEEKQNMLSAMDCWADGQNSNESGPYSWRGTEHTLDIEKKAIEIIKVKKNEPKNLVYFINKLDYKGYEHPNIQDEISKLTFNFEEKLLLKDSVNYSCYYSFPEITKSEIDTYIKENGLKELHTKQEIGCFYYGKEDAHTYKQYGLDWSPIYDASDTTYLGDFKIHKKYGVDLNSFYQEQAYSETYYYFKNESIGFDPRKYKISYSGKYLFALSSSEIIVYDVELDETYVF